MKPDLVSKFTTHLKNALVRAYAFAREVGDDIITPEHLLWALLEEKGSLGAEMLAKAKCTSAQIKESIVARGALTLNPAPAVPALAPEAKRIIEKAVLAANLHDHVFVGTEHLLAGLLEVDDSFVADRKFLKTQLAIVLKSTSKFPELAEHANADGSARPAVAVAEKKKTRKHSKTPALDYFATDLTTADAQKRIDPVVGRAREIERTIEILCRRTKNNPVLLGEPGVGKTAIVEGLAQRISEGAVPEILRDKRILALDLALLVAGATFRGDFEDRMKHIIEEAAGNSNIILFVDELHSIVGAGSASGSLDAANILKPALARGEIRLIGATTHDEYKKYIEGDAALDRRFQPVQVPEPSAEETHAILMGVKERYEDFHGVAISDDAVTAAVRLAERFLTERHFPDKAIDLLDEAAASLKIKTKEHPDQKKIRELERERGEIIHAKEHAVADEEYVKALELKEKELAVNADIASLRARRAGARTPRGTVTEREVAGVVARATGIPAEALEAGERTRLAHLEEELSRRVVGQDEAVRGVSSYLRRARAGLTDPKRPLASFLFVGPSGVGKTELAKAVAEALFAEDAFIRLDMSEFSEGFTTSKLIGAPAGYVGYRDRTALTDRVRRRPYSVVLFDEIEKAHPDVRALLLQILEEAALTDSAGRRASFKNAIIIMTSNIGLDRMRRGSLGFSAGGELTAAELTKDVTKEAEATLRSELVNRLDRIFLFRSLDKKDFSAIAAQEAARLAERLKDQKIILTVSPAAIALAGERAASDEHGARAVRRIFQNDIEGPLAERLIANEKGIKRITVGVKNNAFKFEVK